MVYSKSRACHTEALPVMEISPRNIGSGPASGDSFLEAIALPVKNPF